jgi:hypothetical protein
MKPTYPNLFKKDKYIATCVWKYSEQYENFASDQLQVPIQLIINALEAEINHSTENTLQGLIINKGDMIFNNPSKLNRR